jgi:hypothetical protein
MGIDLTHRWDGFAVYLPAIQEWYSKEVWSNENLYKDRPFPNGLKLKDLDFLNPKSKLWHYGYGLYSAGQFKNSDPIKCSVSKRDRSCTTILGDSGGYQIGMGTFPGTEQLRKIKNASDLVDAWGRLTKVRENVVNWLEATSDYAMTIDMPLWARVSTTGKSPFKICSVDQLIKMSVENLKFIKQNKQGNTKWLNVLQGVEEEDSRLWWNAVKKFKFDGWALAGSVGWSGGLDSVLRNVLMMRDDGAFDEGQDWIHVLGVSRPTWGVIFSAIQRQLWSVNPNLRISYDSASPFQTVGKFQKLVRYPKYTHDLRSWVMSISSSPISTSYCGASQLHFPHTSPLGDLLTLDQLNVIGGSYEANPTDKVTWLLLLNHSLYIYIKAFLEANELAFMNRSDAKDFVPEELLDVLDFIGDVFQSPNWHQKIKKHKKILDDVFKKKSVKRSGEEKLDDIWLEEELS